MHCGTLFISSNDALHPEEGVSSSAGTEKTIASLKAIEFLGLNQQAVYKSNPGAQEVESPAMESQNS